ncbi:MAG: CrcB family protein [Tagaea sp.]|nr:CrcB family protein [Tagaea sp.]
MALGSALGGAARHGVSEAILRHADPAGLPWWTILVNVTGSFAIGYFAQSLADDASGMRAFLLAGVLGGYTTFSAFSLQTLDLARAGDWTGAAMNVALSVVLCLIAVALGFWAGRS